MYTGGAALIAALFSIVFFTSCPNKIDKKEPAQQKVKITVKAGAHVNLTNDKPIEVKQGTKWQEIASKAASKVSYEEDWEAGGWKIGSESGKELTGTDVFNQDTTVFAIAKAGPPKIKLTIQGDSLVQGVPKTIKILKDSAWSAVKVQAQNEIKFADGYTLKEWRKDKSDGELLTDNFVLDKDTTVFAVSAKSVTITVKGDENVTGTPAAFKVLEGSTWAQIKDETLAKIGFKDKYKLDSWHHTDGEGAELQDTDIFTADSTVFAKSKKRPVVNISITIKGDGNVIPLASPVSVEKESKWSEIKAAIERAIYVHEDYEIKEWRKDGASGAVIQDTDIFTEASTVYAVTKVKLTLTIDGDDKLIAGKGETIKIKSGSKWQDIKAEVEAKIDFADNYTLDVWRKSNADGVLINDSYTFTENTTVYAVSKTDPNPKVKITVSAGAGAAVTIASPAVFKVTKGSSWAAIKAKAEAKVTCSEGHVIKEWKYGSPLQSLFDGYIFNNDEAIYVETEKLTAITFEVEGEGGTIKAQAEGEEETFTSPIKVRRGKTVTFTAVPNEAEGYIAVKKWTISSGSFEEGTGTAGITTARLTVTEDVSVKVYFAKEFEVAYNDLETFLTSGRLKDGIVNRIKITGTIPAEDFIGKQYDIVNNIPPSAGTFGKKIQKTSKKIAIILPENTDAVRTMEYCFVNCKNLDSVENMPKKITDMKYCFYRCENLTTAPAIPSEVTNMEGCFSVCKRLTIAPSIPSEVTNMKGCFSSCTNLTTAPAIPSKVKDMSWCFQNCENLATASAIPSEVKNMAGCFSSCENLVTAPAITSEVKNMAGCFKNCKKLTTVTLHCPLPTSDDNIRNAFSECPKIMKGDIKVKNAYLQDYKNKASIMGTTADRFAGF